MIFDDDITSAQKSRCWFEFGLYGSKDLGRLVFNDDGEVVFNFGKHRGVSVKKLIETDPGYYGWMMNGDFPRYTLRVLKQIKEGTFNQ